MKAYRAGQTERIPADHDLPLLFASDSRLHIGFLISLVAVVVIWLLLTRTTFGYEIRTVGGNPEAARFAGIRINWLITRVSLLGGGLCGLAGANAILGVQHVLLSNFSPGLGVHRDRGGAARRADAVRRAVRRRSCSARSRSARRTCSTRRACRPRSAG